MAQALSNLPVGAKVKSLNTKYNNEVIQFIIGHQDSQNSRTKLITERIISLKPFDAKEPTNLGYARDYGGSGYAISNIDQWLNSRTSSPPGWFTPAATHDEPPTSDYVYQGKNAYANQSGFLTNFEDNLYNSILNTSVTTTLSNGTPWTVQRKIYLLSNREVGWLPQSPDEGQFWPYFDSAAKRQAKPTTGAVVASEWVNSNLSPSKNWVWWLRTCDTFSGNWHLTQAVTTTGEVVNGFPYDGAVGIRPALELANTQLVSDTTDSDGCYTFVWNAPPTKPSYIAAPLSINGGSTAGISWGESTDPDGNLAGYILQRSTNGGAWAQIYKGANRTYLDSVALGTNTVQYRVCAYDTQNERSDYETSSVINVVNNQPPAISGTDSNLGTKSSGFTQTYSVTDADDDTVTVQETIDDVVIRSYVVTLGATNTFSVTGETWLKLSNGTHTMKIKATDTAGGSATRTYTFTKSVNSFSIQNTTPYTAEAAPTRIKINVIRNIPAESTFKVEVCNNGYDTTPTWEDATSSVLNSLVHVFTNDTKTAASWGVIIKVTVTRGTGQGACYVSHIGGNFE